MDKYTIINLKLKGHSNREISRQHGIDRKTVAKYWNEFCKEMEVLRKDMNTPEDIREIQEHMLSEPKYDASNRKPVKYTEEMDRFLEEILEQEFRKDNLLGSNKQRLTLKQIHQMMLDAGYEISYSGLHPHFSKKKAKLKEAFIMQEYDLGDRVEYDFGEVKLVIAGVVGTYYMAVFGAPSSKFRWAFLYTNQKKDVFLDSHVRFFEIVDGVYKEVVYDNMKNVVTKFIGRNEKELNADLLKMSMYYGFDINVTNCFSGNEKGYVESSVKVIRKEVFSKKYEFESLEEAEAYLAHKLVELNSDSRIGEEKEHLLSCKPPLELAKVSVQKVDKYSFVRVENNFYSVPEYLVGHEVTIKNYLKELLVYAGINVVAKHKKVDGFGQAQVDIFHYLDTLARKPGALKNSAALKGRTELKAIYDMYFTKRTKEFIDILRGNSEKDYPDILAIAREIGAKGVIYDGNVSNVEQNINEQTKSQLRLLSEMFLGGTEYVN